MVPHKAACLLLIAAGQPTTTESDEYCLIYTVMIRDVECSIVDWESVCSMQHQMADITHANKLTFQFNDQPIYSQYYTEYST